MHDVAQVRDAAPRQQRFVQLQLAAARARGFPASVRGHAREHAPAWRLHRDQPLHELAANLRRAFSGIVTGNVKEHGIAAIERHGPFELHGDPEVMQLLDELLRSFVAEGRMKLPGTVYRPCFRLVK